MPVNQSDISIVYSGGPDNTDPTMSLGGFPSSHLIPGGVDNLFDDVSNAEAVAGMTDYRCFYIFNDSITSTWSGVQVWVESQVSGGSNVFLGIPLQYDTQNINIIGLADSGTFSLDIDGTNVTVPWNNNLVTMALNMQALISEIPNIGGVAVTGSFYNNATTLQIVFQSNLFQSAVAVTANTLVGPSSSIQVIASRLVTGSPINSIATTINVSTTPPAGVTFSLPTPLTPVTIGNLGPSEGFYIWVQRVTPANATPVTDDGFVLRIQGNPQ